MLGKKQEQKQEKNAYEVERNVQNLADAVAQVQRAWDALGFDKNMLLTLAREQVYGNEDDPNSWKVEINRYDKAYHRTLELEAKNIDIGKAFEEIRPILTFVAQGGTLRTR